MSMNPALTEMMAQTRMADMRQGAISRRTNSRGATVRPRGADASPLRHGAVPHAAVRQAIGWFLVGVGLRLAVPRPRPVATR
jgi:hypothetical protein